MKDWSNLKFSLLACIAPGWLKNQIAYLAAREEAIIRIGTVLPGRWSYARGVELVARAEAIGYTPDHMYRMLCANQIPNDLRELLAWYNSGDVANKKPR